MTTLVYWRRTEGYPATSASQVEVCTPAEYHAEYERAEPMLGPGDGQWHAIQGDEDGIDDALGLCGDLTEIGLLCDAMYVSQAVHQHLGLRMAAWDESALWRRDQLDTHDDDTAEDYFCAIRDVYGDASETVARRRYAVEG